MTTMTMTTQRAGMKRAMIDHASVVVMPRFNYQITTESSGASAATASAVFDRNPWPSWPTYRCQDDPRHARYFTVMNRFSDGRLPLVL